MRTTSTVPMYSCIAVAEADPPEAAAFDSAAERASSAACSSGVLGGVEFPSTKAEAWYFALIQSSRAARDAVA